MFKDIRVWCNDDDDDDDDDSNDDDDDLRLVSPLRGGRPYGLESATETSLSRLLTTVHHRSSEPRGVGGTVDCESTLKSAGTPLSRVRALPPVLLPDVGPESLGSSCCRLVIHKPSQY
ncbi:hypothetical protein PoB_007702900 [Plakobranchus ocellatus]|uniref:Uncharacterized protein n=1 Tax=Plakobranchus ocellatus TaxID=259542 RepID=A0AAV4E2N4_9GAST|nr:hypothetical protein PoB_007702900 [Plakobranchus ocellatus]